MLNILLPVDFSEASFNAVRYAARMCNTADFSLDFLHIIFFDDSATPSQVPAELKQQTELGFEKVSAILEEEQCAARSNFHMLHGLQTGHIIQKYIQGSKANLVITDINHPANNTTIFLGGTLHTLLNTARVPMLLIPKLARFTTMADIVYATDLSRADEAPELIAFARLFNAWVHFVHVFPDFIDGKIFEPDKIEEALRAQFNYPRITFDAIMDNHIEKTLLLFVQEKKPDMAAFYTHTYSLMEQLTGKSITEEMSFRLEIPLFAFRKKV